MSDDTHPARQSYPEQENHEMKQPDMDGMAASDWTNYLREHPDRVLVVNAPDGVHAIEYDDVDDRVTFYAHGSRGYDADGTQAVLETIAGESDGLRVQTRAETYTRQEDDL